MEFPQFSRGELPASDIAPEFKSHEPFRFGDHHFGEGQSFPDLLGPRPVWPRPLELPTAGHNTDLPPPRPAVFVPASTDDSARIDALELSLVDLRNQLTRTQAQLEAHAALLHNISMRAELAERETERLMERAKEQAIAIQSLKVMQFKNQLDAGGADPMYDTQ